MNIQETRKDGRLVVAPSGRLDSINAPILDRRLTSIIEGGDKRLIIDLSSLDYISSIGLSTLLSAAKKIKQVEGGRIVLAGMNPRIRTVIEISRLDKIFVIFDNVTVALAEP